MTKVANRCEGAKNITLQA